MNYLSISFAIFFLIFLLLYNFTPTRYKYLLIFLGSYIFYGWLDFRVLSILLLVSLITYCGGLMIEARRSKGVYLLFFFTNIAVLAVFKYSVFVVNNYNHLAGCLGLTKVNSIPSWALPVGLSFIVFQASTYLTEIYNEQIKAERNFILVGAFVAFFPTILSGPIQKAKKLLPQIKTPKNVIYEDAIKGLLLFIWGAFEKIVIANRLLTIVNTIFENIENYNGVYLLLGAVSFSLYIYADFSSYSDMARGVAKLLGVDVGRNFINPYLATSTGEFWNRWHVSLNEWFIENVYIPMGGSRKGKIRTYINIFIIFLISGLWHGANWHFVAWGCVNGLLVIIGKILMPLKADVYKKIGVAEECKSIVLLRRFIVFLLITDTWIFFNNGIKNSFIILRKIFSILPVQMIDEQLLCVTGDYYWMFITLIMVFIFYTIQKKRQDESKLFAEFICQPIMFQMILLSIIICICIFCACATSANVNENFLYFNF